VSQVQASVKTLTADFEQVKTSHLLAQPSHSSGRFYYRAPDSVRWEYTAPHEMTVLITGGVALTYRPAEKRAERIEVGRAQHRVLRFMSAAEPLEKLTAYFTFTFIDAGGNANYVLRLKPVAHTVKKRLRSVEIEIDRTRYLPVKLSYTEADGDSTVYSFSDIRLNPEQPPGLYALDLPPDVQVVRIKLGSGEQ
jgi:outer membrane lipoprotein-sorting protein